MASVNLAIGERAPDTNMAKRKRNKHVKQKLARIREKQSKGRPQEKLNRATAWLKEGDFEQAIQAAEELRSRQTSPEIDATATKVLVEALFRAAAGEADLQTRLQLLTRARSIRTDDARLHYHIGLTNLRLRNFKVAAQDFDTVARLAPERSDTAYFQALIQLGLGQALNEEQISSAPSRQQHTLLYILDRFRADAASDELRSLTARLENIAPWEALLKLAGSKTAAPVAAFEAALSQNPHKNNPLLRYYAGVAAMRKKDRALARKHWQNLDELGARWIQNNAAALYQEELARLAAAGNWERIVADQRKLASSSAQIKKNKALREIVGAAYFHEGYRAAEQQRWGQAASLWTVASQFSTDRLLLQNQALVQEAMGDWATAAASWREMIKRRPRKETHPDYLSDDQVAAIWGRAAGAYALAENYSEGITCMKNALKYNEDNLQMRLTLVSLYAQEDRVEAAINELHRILDIDGENVEALKQLAVLYELDPWRYNARAVWRRILELEPHNRDARDALAQSFIEEVEEFSIYSYRSRYRKSPEEIIEEGLKLVPNHPKLFYTLALIYLRDANREDEASELLQKAWQINPSDVQLSQQVMRQLLRLEREELVEAMIPQVQQSTRAPAAFWLLLAHDVMEDEGDVAWVQRFWDQAYRLSETGHDLYTPLMTLLTMFDDALDEGEEELADMVEERVRKEAPKSGAEEYMQAHRAAVEEGDPQKALRLIRKAKAKLKKRNEKILLEKIDEIEAKFSGPPPMILDLIERMGLDPSGPPPSPLEMMEILANMDEETLDEFTRFVGN